MLASRQTRRRNLAELLADGLAYSVVRRARKRALRQGDFRHIVVPIDDIIGMRVAATGRFELTQFDAIRTLLDNPQGLLGIKIDREQAFVDVGANIGLYSIALSRYFKQTLAFEANPITFKVLEANLALCDADTTAAFNLGLSDQSGEASIYVPKNGNLGWATMSATHHRLPVSELKISIDTLDRFLAAEPTRAPRGIALMKIDVEGHEPHVLSGARSVLERDGPVVFFEALNSAAAKACTGTLSDSGYNRFYTFQRRLSGTRGGISGYMESLFKGVPVVIEEITPDEIGRNALVCAVRKPA